MAYKRLYLASACASEVHVIVYAWCGRLITGVCSMHAAVLIGNAFVEGSYIVLLPPGSQ